MKHLLLLSAFGLLAAISTSAQTNGKPTPKTNTDSLKLVVQISENQLKLGKLQNTVDQKTKNKQDAADKSQESADKNREAAEKLSGDPQDKKLAKKADNDAGDARSDAKKARKESGRLDKVNKDILDLKEKIASDQSKLSVYTNITPMATVVVPATPPADTTNHH